MIDFIFSSTLNQTIFYILVFIIITYSLALRVLAYYITAMKFKYIRDEDRLPDNKFIRFNFYIILLRELPLYLILNLIFASILFLDPPREWQFTKRCQRYIKEGNGFLQFIKPIRKLRRKIAKWICKNALDPFEEGGHC